MASASGKVAVLGASGLIGEAVALHLIDRGLDVTAIARGFTDAQKALLGDAALETGLVPLDQGSFSRLITDRDIGIVFNCIGVLQDGSRGSTEAVHMQFAEALVSALRQTGKPVLLVHLSIPGEAGGDRTAFSRTKRAAERAIAQSGLPHVILRPGFVVAPAAYGGSALIRAVAALPFDLPAHESGCVFMSCDVADIARTLTAVTERWQAGDRDWTTSWDLMHPDRLSVGDVVAAFRDRFGGPRPRLALPGWLMRLGAVAGDLAAWLGWSAPVRTTALMEMRRGIEGNPGPWIAETGLEPAPLDAALARLPASVQEKWFARIYLAKPFVIGILALFWSLSGLIALTVSFDAAAAVLIAHGFPVSAAIATTLATGCADMVIGALISIRRTCRTGLLAGIALSVFYLAAAAVIAPELWIEPLGALVKIVPAIVLMLVALAILDDR